MQNTPKEKNKRIKQNATMLILKMLKFILSARVVSVKFSLKHMKALLSNYKLVRTLTSITFPDSFHFVEKYCAEFFWLVPNHYFYLVGKGDDLPKGVWMEIKLRRARGVLGRFSNPVESDWARVMDLILLAFSTFIFTKQRHCCCVSKMTIFV